MDDPSPQENTPPPADASAGSTPSVVQKTLETFTICTTVVGPDDRVTELHGVAESRWGRPVDEILGQPLAEVAPDLVDAVQRARAGESVEYTHESTHDGLPAFFNNVVTAAESGDGSVVCYSMDITARVWMEHGLKDTMREFQEQSRILEAVFACMAEGVVVTDPHGNYLFRNPAADRILGLGASITMNDRPELEGAYHPDQRTLLTEDDQPLTCALRGENCDQVEIYLKNPHVPQGANLVVSSQPLRDEETGDLIGALGVFHDISERKRMEEGRILLERKMAQAGKLATVGQLADGIANEINDLLQVINGFCEMLADAVELEGDLLDYVGHIRSASDRCGSIVTQLLALAKQDQDSRDPVDLNTCAKEVCDFLTHQFQMENIKLESHLARRVDPILANEGEIQQILFHLLINAMDAMPGGGALTVSTAQVDQKVRLLVRDTGEGIPADDLPRIFEPFFTTKAGQSGPGLGLSIVNAVIERLDGTIKVDSTPGSGTSFLIEFPTTFADGLDAASSGPDLSHLVPLKILVVDDEPLVRSLCSAFLSSDGHTVAQASSGEDALEMLESGEYDVVLTDLAMPGMGGQGLLAALAAQENPPRIVVMSGRVEDPEPVAETHPEVVAVLRKPFQKGALREIIGEINLQRAQTPG